MGYYSVEDFVKQKRQRGSKAIVPPKANFFAAANHIRDLFEGKKLTYGVMGGLEMLCLGYQRDMHDLQIAYDDRDFHRLKDKLEADRRIRLPEGINSLFPAKILIRTGPSYKDEGCTQAADIEVDLVPPGFHGTPSGGSLTNNLVLLSQKTGGKLRTYKGLNMLYLVKTLVHYCRVRDLAWDPRKDLLFLCQHYGDDVQAVRSQLDPKAVQQSFLGTPFFSHQSPDDQRKCYKILLGTEPPPTMAITPPAPPFAHKHSFSAQDVSNEPRSLGHKPSQSLNAQNSLELLSPQPLGKPDQQRHVPDVHIQISELPALPSSHWRTSSEQVTTGRDSRSRYRPVSAPSSRNVSPAGPHIAVPKIKHTRQLSHQLVPPARKYQSHRVSSYQLQPPKDSNPAHVVTHSPKLTPNLNAGPLPAYAFAKTPSLNYDAPNPHIYMSPAEITATKMPLNPGPHRMSSQIGTPAQRHSNLLIAEKPLTLEARSAHQTQQEARAELSSTSMPDLREKQLRVVNPDHSRGLEVPSQAASHPQGTSVLLAPVELDATCPIGQFIAELSADQSTSVPDSQFKTHSSQQQSQVQPQIFSTALHTSSISPPDSTTLQDVTPRPLNPRTHSAPSTTLPASLTPGGSSSHHRTTSTTLSDATEIPTTNASRYSRFYASLTPPASTSGSPQNMYKAYQPSLAPAAMTLSPEKRVSGYVAKGHKRDLSIESTGSGSGSEELAQGYRDLLSGYGSS